MKTLSAAMTKLAYFAYNFNSNFIEEAWGPGSLCDHLKAKFATSYDKKGPTAGFWDFYMDLSQDNQDKLNEYVLNNYKGTPSLDEAIFSTTKSVSNGN